MEEEKVLLCKLNRDALENKIHIYDATVKEGVCEQIEFFTIMPNDIKAAVKNKDLMAQLGENILIRLATINNIEL